MSDVLKTTCKTHASAALEEKKYLQRDLTVHHCVMQRALGPSSGFHQSVLCLTKESYKSSFHIYLRFFQYSFAHTNDSCYQIKQKSTVIVRQESTLIIVCPLIQEDHINSNRSRTFDYSMWFDALYLLKRIQDRGFRNPSDTPGAYVRFAPTSRDQDN